MSDGYGADADRIGARAKDFGDHADRAREVAATLQSALEAETQAWGSDVVGQSFAGAHAEPAASALRQVSGLSGEFDALGSAFTGAADTYRSTDDAAAKDTAAAERDLEA